MVDKGTCGRMLKLQIQPSISKTSQKEPGAEFLWTKPQNRDVSFSRVRFKLKKGAEQLEGAIYDCQSAGPSRVSRQYLVHQKDVLPQNTLVEQK
jgi:hypothetical protein